MQLSQSELSSEELSGLSERDSSLTGIRGLPVNNRGSDLGQNLLLDKLLFSHISVFLALCCLLCYNSSLGDCLWYFHQHIRGMCEGEHSSINEIKDIFLVEFFGPNLRHLKGKRSKFPKKWKESKVADFEIGDIIDLNRTSVGQTQLRLTTYHAGRQPGRYIYLLLLKAHFKMFAIQIIVLSLVVESSEVEAVVIRCVKTCWPRETG